MRINRLDLTRYGIFTDQSINFGERASNAPDLHIIYGPNEAGKSTAFAAFLDLVFGIETRSRYAFLHPYPTMRIGGEIEINDTSRNFSRIKRPQNSLLDEADNPISDGIILGDLGGIDRGSYRTMFSLDDDTLEAGGESILASKGDLGQLLFAASAGLSDLSQKLIDLRVKADGFYKYRASGGKLSELKERLAELKKQREKIDTIAPEYAKLVEDRDRALDQYDGEMEKRGLILSKLEELQRQVAALPRLVAVKGLRERIMPLAEIPDAPLGWVEDLPELQKDEIKLTTRAKSIALDIKDITDELSGIVADDRIFGHAERIDLLVDSRARYVTADKDLPERRLQQRDADVAITGILASIDCDPDIDPSSLLLGAVATGALRELMEQRSGTVAGAETAEEELTEAQHRLSAAQDELKDVGGELQLEAASTASQLASVVSLAQGDDYAVRHRLEERGRLEQIDILNRHMRALLPWTGEPEELRNLCVPTSSDIECWKDEIGDAGKRVNRHQEEIERLSSELHRLNAEVEATDKVAGVVSDQQAATIRTEREEAWAEHKRTMDISSAEVFESRLRHDDIVTNSRVSNATEVANLQQIGKTLSNVNADLKTERESQSVADDKLKVSQGEVAAEIQRISPALPRNWNLVTLEAWLVTRSNALETLTTVEKSQRKALEAEQDGKTIRRKLTDAANATGIEFSSDASVETLISLLQTAIDRAEEVKRLRSDVVDLTREVTTRKRRAQKARDAEQAWNESWAKQCSGNWLGNKGKIPAVSTVREMLKALDELSPLIQGRTSLVDRIQKMGSDQCRFREEVETLADLLDIETTSSPLDLASQITRTLENARTAKISREATTERLRAVEARKKGNEEEKKIHDRRKDEMLTHFNVSSLGEVDRKLRDLERRGGFEEQLGEETQEILTALDEESIEEAEIILDNLNRNVTETEIAQLQGRFENHDKRSHELFTELSNALDRLESVGGDDAVVRIEERRRTARLEIEEGATRYLRLRLGVTAAEQALRIYRDEHRSSMMTRASEAFKVISRGAYKGLSTQPDRDSDMLVAEVANGGSKSATELSRGTRFQLYLALRVAGYLEFAQERPSVPFVADDIMETFDDFRAEEALKLFDEMAQKGQVIYLTHHQHLCEIAKRVCPNVKVHELVTDTS